MQVRCRRLSRVEIFQLFRFRRSIHVNKCVRSYPDRLGVGPKDQPLAQPRKGSQEPETETFALHDTHTYVLSRRRALFIDDVHLSLLFRVHSSLSLAHSLSLSRSRAYLVSRSPTATTSSGRSSCVIILIIF